MKSAAAPAALWRTAFALEGTRCWLAKPAVARRRRAKAGEPGRNRTGSGHFAQLIDGTGGSGTNCLRSSELATRPESTGVDRSRPESSQVVETLWRRFHRRLLIKAFALSRAEDRSRHRRGARSLAAPGVGDLSRLMRQHSDRERLPVYLSTLFWVRSLLRFACARRSWAGHIG